MIFSIAFTSRKRLEDWTSLAQALSLLTSTFCSVFGAAYGIAYFWAVLNGEVL
jgi:hypothetical protein